MGLFVLIDSLGFGRALDHPGCEKYKEIGFGVACGHGFKKISDQRHIPETGNPVFGIGDVVEFIPDTAETEEYADASK